MQKIFTKQNGVLLLLFAIVFLIAATWIINGSRDTKRRNAELRLFQSLKSAKSEAGFKQAVQKTVGILRENQPISFGFNKSKAIMSNNSGEVGHMVEVCDGLIEQAWNQMENEDEAGAYRSLTDWDKFCYSYWSDEE